MRKLAVVLALLLSPAATSAQDTVAVAPGARLRVSTTDHARITGRLQQVTDSALVLSARGSDDTIALSRISQLELSQGRRWSVVGGIVGAVVGVGVGGVVACHFNRDSYGVFCGGQDDTKLVIGAAIGGVVGAALGGWLFGRERWRPVDPARLSRR